MKFSIRYADKVVGTLVILGLAILVFVVFMLGRNQRWFVHDYQYKTYFNSAAGISVNMAVQYKGFTIGHVKKISLSDDDRVEVVFSIFEEYHERVTEGSLVEVQISPIGLGNSFHFYPGRGANEIPEGYSIPEIHSIEARESIIRGLANVPRTNDSIGNIVNQVNTLLETINISLSGLQGADDLALGQIINNLASTINNASDFTGTLTYQIDQLIVSINEQLASVTEPLSSQLTPILSNINTLTEQLADPSGTVMAILDAEGPVYEGLSSSITSLSDVIGNLNKVVEFVPANLPQIGVIITELNTALRTVQDVMTAVANNPLLRGGIPVRAEAGPGGASPRNLLF
ncbi:MAG: MlaD family protein [Treponema sp.]|nr:MlaD family protein [Treponema sp.]